MKPDFKIFAYYKYSWLLFALAGLCLIIQTIFNILFYFALAHLLAYFFFNDFNFRLYFFLLAASACLILIFKYLANYFINLLCANLKKSVRQGLINKFYEADNEFYKNNLPSQIISVYTKGIDAIDDYFIKFLPEVVLCIFATPAIYILIFIYDKPSAIIVGIILPIIPVFMVIIGLYTQKIQNKQWEATRVISGHFSDIIAGINELKIFKRIQYQIKIIKQISEQNRLNTMQLLSVSFMSGFVLEVCVMFGVALVAISIGQRLQTGEVEFFVALYILLLATQVFIPIKNVGSYFHASSEGIASMKDIIYLLNITSSLQKKSLENKIQSLEFKGFSARNLSLNAKICVGDFICIKSPSSGGKSSIFEAVLGYGAYRGEIYINKQNIDLSLISLKNNISWLASDCYLYHTSIKENIILNSGYNASLFEKAVKFANIQTLDIDKTILPDSRGVSKGQAQRICLARCFYRALLLKTPILLLDEPTSALDGESENIIINACKEFAQNGYIVIAISHRPSFHASSKVIELI